MPAPTFCPSCWARVPDNSRTCPECGKGMTDFPTKSAAKKPAPPPLPAAPRPASRPRNRDDDEIIQRPRPARRRVEDHEPEPSGGSHTALIAVLAGGGVLFLALLAGGIFLLVRHTSKPDAAEAKANPPVVTPLADAGPGPAKVAPVERPTAKPAPPPAIKDNAIAAVKASTVYIKCQHRGGKASGSGFFTGKPGYVVTNAHVIGQMPAQSREEAMAGQVQRIEVVVNSGEPNERNFIARVYGIDRVHDLAILSIDGENLPPPLEFGNAAGLNETDEVIIFGYPFGEMVGKNISINKSTVTSLRKKNGELDMVQIGGGMNPGNSGGPVTNRAGQVVGVSVAKILGADGIDFAIPAERAESFVREQFQSGGNGPEEVAKGPPPPVGLLPGLRAPPFGPPTRPGRPGRAPVVPRPAPQPAAPEPPTREAPGWGPKPVRSVTGAKPQMLGFGIGPEFRELAPKDGVMIGLELGLAPDGNRFLVRQATPIYLVGDKEVKGERRGHATGPTVTLKAKTGYAVGALICKHGLAVDGISLVFMKVKGTRLDTKDNYESEWAGSSPSELQATRLEGGGLPAVGLVGRADERNLIAIATVFRGQEEAIGPVAPSGTKQTQIIGGGNQEFQDLAPDGGLLVGFHFGMGKFFDNDVIHGVRPIYRVGEKEKLGTPYGTDFTRLTKVVAKPGYAVGAIAVKTGLGVDGVTVTFMKVDGDKLDPSDSYESDYIGGPGGGGPTKVGGDGTPVVGLIGRTNGKEVCGLGLVVKK